MSSPSEVSGLPQAPTPERVSPLWRLLALVEFLGLAVLVGGAVYMGGLEPRETTRYVPIDARNTPSPVRVGAAGGGAPSAPVEPPVPSRQDLAEQRPIDDVDASVSKTPRARFLALGSDVMSRPAPFPATATVSPDGKLVAFTQGADLFGGPLKSSFQLTFASGERELSGTARGPRAAAGAGLPKVPEPSVPEGPLDPRMGGMVAWTPDSRVLYWSDLSGRLHTYTVEMLPGKDDLPQGLDANRDEAIPIQADWPAPLGGEAKTLVYVRPVFALGIQRNNPSATTTEVVFGDLQGQVTRVLAPASGSTWSYLCLSPDGKRVAGVSNFGLEGSRQSLQRLFVMDLASGNPTPVAGPSPRVGPVFWMPDGKALVYSRSQAVPTADQFLGEPNNGDRLLDIYSCDLGTGKESRLSYGGGFSCAGLSRDGTLFYLTLKREKTEHSCFLRQVPLKTAQEFAAKEPSYKVIDEKSWGGFLRQIPGEPSPSGAQGFRQVSAEGLAKIADGTRRGFKEQFLVDMPQTAQGLDRLHDQIELLGLSPGMVRQTESVLGILAADYLVRRHGAKWCPAQSSASDMARPEALANDNPFVIVVDPLDRVWQKLPGQSTGLVEVLRNVHGRSILLAADAGSARARIVALTDPSLVEGERLLKTDKGEEGEKVLLNLLKQPVHQKNDALAWTVAQLLFQAERPLAARNVLEQLVDRRPREAQRFNLLGLTWLKADPKRAAEIFKKALRCDLRCGTAYLNLADAYIALDELGSARTVLQRCLENGADGVSPADVRHRLSAVSEKMTALADKKTE